MGKENFIHRIFRRSRGSMRFSCFCRFSFCVRLSLTGWSCRSLREHVSEMTVPMLEGLDSVSAVALARDSGFGVVFSEEREYSKAFDMDLVMRQNPSAGARIKPGRTIRLTISDGLHQFTVPDLFDKNAEEAATAIRNAGLSVGLTFHTPHPAFSKGKVVRTNPSEGSLVHKGDTVDVFLSSGPSGKQIELPGVVGLSLSAAASNLRSAGFIVGKTSRGKYSDVPAEKSFRRNRRRGRLFPPVRKSTWSLRSKRLSMYRLLPVLLSFSLAVVACSGPKQLSPSDDMSRNVKIVAAEKSEPAKIDSARLLRLEIAHGSFLRALALERQGEFAIAEEFMRHAYEADSENRYLAFSVLELMIRRGAGASDGR